MSPEVGKMGGVMPRNVFHRIEKGHRVNGWCVQFPVTARRGNLRLLVGSMTALFLATAGSDVQIPRGSSVRLGDSQPLAENAGSGTVPKTGVYGTCRPIFGRVCGIRTRDLRFERAVSWKQEGHNGPRVVTPPAA